MRRAERGSVDATGIKCNCHGSTYDVNGAVTGGPAFSPLVHYKVTVAADGAITIDANAQVAATERTKVG